MEESEKDAAFKITDKRKFTPEGGVRTDPEDSRTESSPSESQAHASKPTSSETHESPGTFQMTFETLVMSLSSTAMVQLGLIPDPTTNQPAKNLATARQTIDILEILQAKTKGNLDESESKLLDNILYELRMIFLEVSQSIKVP